MTDPTPSAPAPADPSPTLASSALPGDQNSGTARRVTPGAPPAGSRHTSAPEFGTETSAKRRPLFGTIFWGVLLLAFAAFMVAWTVLPTPDPTLWLLGGVIAIGLVLVAAGIAAASRRAG
jgi:hypothetical protein